MRREYRDILKKNNLREREINKENNEVYTNMITYLRGSDIDIYNQEQVRLDLIEMIIDGQERGDNIKKIMGYNYKEICDDIIAVFPKKSKKQKIIDIISIGLICIWVLTLITIIQTCIVGFIKEEKVIMYSLSVGNILNMIIAIIAVNFIINYIFKNSFDKVQESKIARFIKLWIVFMAIITGEIALGYYLDYVVINISIIYVIIFLVAIFFLERIVSSKI